MCFFPLILFVFKGLATRGQSELLVPWNPCIPDKNISEFRWRGSSPYLDFSPRFLTHFVLNHTNDGYVANTVNM